MRLNMNKKVYDSIVHLLDTNSIPYTILTHRPSKTSEESRLVRAELGYPNAVGAKALLVKLYLKDTESFATIVLPGDHILDKEKLFAHIPDLKKIRFVTPDEMFDLTGLVPGSMPPFATPIFPRIPLLIIASAIEEHEELGFNIADLERSTILKSKEYLSIVKPNFVINCSTPKIS